MTRLFRILRLVPLAFFCAMFATAALHVQAERADSASQPLPSRLRQPSFLEATFREMNEMWLNLYDAAFPGLIADQAVQQPQNLSSLDALKLRTRRSDLPAY